MQGKGQTALTISPFETRGHLEERSLNRVTRIARIRRGKRCPIYLVFVSSVNNAHSRTASFLLHNDNRGCRARYWYTEAYLKVVTYFRADISYLIANRTGLSSQPRRAKYNSLPLSLPRPVILNLTATKVVAYRATILINEESRF